MGLDWTDQEVDLIVQDYFNMFVKELSQQKYNKTAHRTALLPLLVNRTNGAVEYKHQNISAALVNMDQPYIKGYKPAFNYQKPLLDIVVAKYLERHKAIIEGALNQFSTKIVAAHKSNPKFETFLEEPPSNMEMQEHEHRFVPIKTNYLEKEQNNRQLGEAGEQLIIEYEKWRLTQAGKSELAEMVKWVSKEKGDGLGYDILSKNEDGSDRFIEVKTTKLSKETPIYLTSTELAFAALNENNFYLYRVYNFDSNPQFFIKQGSYKLFCQLQPITYRAYF